MNKLTASISFFLAFIIFGLSGCSASNREFSVVAYNVENLFDLDGIAIYSDYEQDEPDDPFTYGRLKLLTRTVILI